MSLQFKDGSRVEGGIQVFQIHGVLYHTHGPLEAVDHNQACYAQTWLHDSEMAHRIRTNRNGNLDANIL